MSTRRKLLLPIGLLTTMGGGGLLPYMIDFTLQPTGAMPSPFNAPTWTIVNGVGLSNTPTGTQLSTDVPLEGGYTGGKADVLTAGGTPAVTTQSADAHSPTKAQHIAGVAVNDRVYLSKPGVVGKWFRMEVWFKRVSGTNNLSKSNMFQSGQLPIVSGSYTINTASYAVHSQTMLATATGTIFSGWLGGGAVPDPVIMDDLSVMNLDHNPLWALYPPTQLNVTAQLRPSTPMPYGGDYFGLIVRADGDPNPTNCLYILTNTVSNGNIAFGVMKKIGTVYTLVAGFAQAAIVTNALLETVVVGISVTVKYNNLSVLTYTITDAELQTVSAIRHGMFSSGKNIIKYFALLGN